MIRFTKHAQEAISIRDITIDWIEAAVSAPDWIEPDPRHPNRTRSYKAIAEDGARRASSRRTSARGDPRGGYRRLFAPDRSRRGRHPRPAESAPHRADRSENRRPSGPHR